MTTIAVVEDNLDNRLLIQIILEEKYQVQLFDDGYQALEGFRASKPDVILLDISLPSMDGVEVLKQIRANETLKDIPVIALTAHSNQGDSEKFIKEGFNDYVSKPIVDEQILFQTINRYITS